MPNFTATEAKRNFGKVLNAVEQDPVFISRNGKLAAIMVSMAAFRRLSGQEASRTVRPEIERLLQESIKRHGDVYKALSKLG